MRIKKKTRALMLAASAVAVIGVAAVSFAAWSGNNNVLETSATTGTAVLEGFEANAELNFGGTKLVPFDQGTKENSYDTATCTTMLTATIPAFNALGTYSFTVDNLEFEKEVSGNYSIWAYIGENAEFTGDNAISATSDPSATGSGWVQIVTGDAAQASFTNDEWVCTATNSKVENRFTIAVKLVTSDTNLMNQTFSFKLTLNNNQQA